MMERVNVAADSMDGFIDLGVQDDPALLFIVLVWFTSLGRFIPHGKRSNRIKGFCQGFTTVFKGAHTIGC
jgi:hypothetical protein